ncbi:MAG: FtsX-like permease family protein [Treponemataceae bacterium]
MKDSTVRDIALMALRNLGRHRVKTIITTTAVAISVALYIFIDGWLLGMNLESRRNIVSYETGAAKIQTNAYFAKKDELPMYESFTGAEELSAKLTAAGYDSAPRFVFSGTLYSREGTAPMVFNAVDPVKEAKLLRYVPYIEAGRFPEPGKREIAVGTLSAAKLRIGIPERPEKAEFDSEILGAATNEEEAAFVRSFYTENTDGTLSVKKDGNAADRDRLWKLLAATGRMTVRISTVIDMKDADKPGAIRHVNQLIDATVVGVINSPNPKTNANVAYLPIDALQDESGMMLGGKVTEILIRASDAKDSVLPQGKETPERILTALGSALPTELALRGWKDYTGDYFAASAQDNVTSRIMIIMLFILSFIGIANTMLMAILERTKETGMLRALGMTDSQVLLAYVIEAGCIGAIGSIIGILIGCLINIPMVVYGIDYSAMSKEMSGDYGYRIVAYFRSAWNPLVIILSGVVATILSAASAIPPTLRALKMPVTDSLRFE